MNKKVAFICVHNSCRSQIAEALCKILRPELEVYSAGIEIVSKINIDAVRIMKDNYEIDMTNQFSKLIKDIPCCDIYISMGCNVGCPFVDKGYDYNFEIEDPSGKNDETFINVIEEIKFKIINLNI